ncbi:MAG TPA: hypothetical protein PLZ50_02820, partial [Rubrivivax sp.]|nr:hypothetical protein [Rubrivivax sp.]
MQRRPAGRRFAWARHNRRDRAATDARGRRLRRMNIIILDDYQDAVRKLECAALLEPYNAKV